MEIVASQTIYNDFSKRLFSGSHNFLYNTYMVALTNVTPNPDQVMFTTLLNLIPESHYGYPNNGYQTVTSIQRVNNISYIFGTPVTFTASGGRIGPFRYAIVYNINNGYLVCWFDYQLNIILEPTETFTAQYEGGIIMRAGDLV